MENDKMQKKIKVINGRLEVETLAAAGQWKPKNEKKIKVINGRLEVETLAAAGQWKPKNETYKSRKNFVILRKIQLKKNLKYNVYTIPH